MIGERIVGAAPSLAHTADLVRWHHERPDGTGYPDALRGDEIPIGARIIAVADVFDAMVSDRPYRGGRSIEDALAELRRCAGTQFDPAVVAAFAAEVRDHGRMAWISPLTEGGAPEGSRSLAAAHAATGGRMTNMKWTLAHSPAALGALLQWYPLHDEVAPMLGERRTQLFCLAISVQNDCLICSTFFRRLLADAGDDPDALELDELDELIVDFGRRLAVAPHSVDDALRARLDAHFTPEQIVLLTAFGAIMVATNVVNDALGVPLDGYLEPYRARAA